MSEQQEKIMYLCTHASDNAEKAHLPFVMANAALAMDIQATVVLQGEGVYLAQKGYIDHMVSGGGFPPIKELLKSFLEQGGQLLVCVPCIQSRHIEEHDLIEGSKTTAAGNLNILATEANAVFVY
jgi:predicted peroxiredoxin